MPPEKKKGESYPNGDKSKLKIITILDAKNDTK
jgi:hypothetical protein